MQKADGETIEGVHEGAAKDHERLGYKVVGPYVLPTDVQNARSFSWSVLGGLAFPLSKLRSAPPAMPPGRRPLFATSPSPPVSIPEAVPIATATILPASRRRITVYADNVDVGEVLMGIAKATGLNVLVSSQIRTRVTATLVDVPAEEAVRAIVATAGLSLLAPDAPGRATIVFRRQDAASEPLRRPGNPPVSSGASLRVLPARS